MTGAEDLITPFQVADTPVRGRVVRLGGAIDEILSRHPFDDAARELVGEAAVLVAAMGAGLKFDGRLILQAQGDGPAPMLVADYAAGGRLRATASVSGEIADDARGLKALLGAGHLAMTIDQGPDMDRYQGVTPLESETLEEAAAAYFDQSEQIPTVVRLAVGKLALPGQAPVWRAGGVIAQFVPAEGGARERGEAILKTDEDHEIWDRAAAFVRSTHADELLDPALGAHDLLYRLFHEDGVRVYDDQKVKAACSCSVDAIGAVLSRYSEEDLADMVEDGAIRVTCEFCRTTYLFDHQGAAMPQ